MSAFVNNLKKKKGHINDSSITALKQVQTAHCRVKGILRRTQLLLKQHASEAVYTLYAGTERRSGRTGPCQGRFPKINPVRIRKESDRNKVPADFCCSVSVS